MPRHRTLSRHARALLAALLDVGNGWSHGYDLCSVTGIKSGTLYPLLIRLESQGYLEAEWRQPVASGRPPRHVYRLTAAGRQLARSEGAALDRAEAGADWRTGEARS